MMPNLGAKISALNPIEHDGPFRFTALADRGHVVALAQQVLEPSDIGALGSEWHRLLEEVGHGGVDAVRSLHGVHGDTSLVLSLEVRGKVLLFTGVSPRSDARSRVYAVTVTRTNEVAEITVETVRRSA